MWTSITSGKRNITVDLPLVANFVSGWYKPGKDSASKILDDIRRKDNWKHHRGEIAAGWVCGSGLRSFRTRAKVFLDAG